MFQVNVVSSPGIGQGLYPGVYPAHVPVIGGLYREADGAAASQPRTYSAASTVLGQPVVLKKTLVIPSVGSVDVQSSQTVPTLSQLSGPLNSLGGQPVRAGNIPITLNCDLNSLAYSGAPQRLQVSSAPSLLE